MNHGRRVMSILIAAMLICTFTGYSGVKAQAKEGENIKTLDSQEKNKNDVLAIKKTIQVEDFKGYKWLDNNRILGVSYKNDDYRNIAIYNVTKNTVEELTNYKGTEKYIDTIKEKSEAKCHYQYKELIKDFVLFSVKTGGSEPYKILSYDLKNDKLVKVDENVGASKYAGNNKLYYTKGFQLFRYDLVSNSKTEIKLPVDLTSNLKSFVSTFEEYEKKDLEEMKNDKTLSQSVIDKFIEQDKEYYEYKKLNNKIVGIDIEGEEIQCDSFNDKYYTYNMKNNTFREGKIKHEHKGKRSGELLIGKVAKELFQENELWKIDNNGNNIKLIDTAPIDFVRNFYLSPDKTKLIYEVFYEEYPNEKTLKKIYDFDTDKKITVSGDYDSCYFNNDSDRIIFNGNVPYKNSKIVILND
ncbi:hypothetical protein SH1V18_05430 [Vallitalea longa]|uniref:Uncharacterized protein n=1 Tax=Vallitalea longa TaxID=2936439 RepID=A0A9W5YB68_9FIRM|nr:hypothetical protein [Vallitalea longa]GKX28063.1 hypothetical protein SH1V18_05430 [Vallitalea longa]